MTPEQTLSERWNIWAKQKNLCTDCTAMSEEFFLAQFDAMLAQDIEKMDRSLDTLPFLNKTDYEAALWVATKNCKYLLEARRLYLKK